MKNFLIFLGGTVLAVGVWLWLGGMKAEDLISPLSAVIGNRMQKNEYKMVGFLPAWMVGKTIKYDRQLDEIIFLGVGVKENGDLDWDFQAKKIDNEDYLAIKNEIKRHKGKNILGIKLFEDEKLKILMSDREAQKNLISQLVTVIKEKGFDGINVDFEYQADPLAVVGEDFLDFMTDLKSAVPGTISVDVFANTIIKASKEDILKLEGLVDEIIIMAYDFHRPGVDYAGSVAPIRANIGERSIWEVVERIKTAGLTQKKYIMAYPLYGYEWKTETGEFESKIERGWYQMASLNRIETEMIPNLKNDNGTENWDELSMTPWINYEEDGGFRQVYYDNRKSLRYKMDVVKQAGVKGVGFWALGYEPTDSGFWTEIKNELAKNE